MTTQSELERAVAQPWKVYRSPEDVLADDSLSDDEKRQILESWERDARELAVAEDENMGGGEPNMLDRVAQALNTLPVSTPERPRGPATMHGSQPAPSSAPKSEAETPGGPKLSSDEARQGEVILNTPTRRIVFFGALILSAILALVFFVYADFLAG
ncbi:MAG: hypothetical protein Tsb0032_18020 [Kiloniellaceae bacterium]